MPASPEMRSPNPLLSLRIIQITSFGIDYFEAKSTNYPTSTASSYARRPQTGLKMSAQVRTKYLCGHAAPAFDNHPFLSHMPQTSLQLVGFVQSVMTKVEVCFGALRDECRWRRGVVEWQREYGHLRWKWL